jgi:hypothetical protein
MPTPFQKGYGVQHDKTGKFRDEDKRFAHRSSILRSEEGAMRIVVVVAVLLLCGWAIWQPSLHDLGIAFVIVALTLIAGVGRLGIGFVRPPGPQTKGKGRG